MRVRHVDSDTATDKAGGNSDIQSFETERCTDQLVPVGQSVRLIGQFALAALVQRLHQAAKFAFPTRPPAHKVAVLFEDQLDEEGDEADKSLRIDRRSHRIISSMTLALDSG
jgi:hypothetical protein